jgi:hypothetical protein
MSHLVLRVRQQPIVVRQQKSVHSENCLNTEGHITDEHSLLCENEQAQTAALPAENETEQLNAATLS